jgi:hypothetical protein
MSLHTFLSRARRPAAVAVSAALLGASMTYAAGIVGQPADPQETAAAAAAGIRLVDDDGDKPMFTLPGMAPGETASSCIAVTNGGSVPVEVALHARKAGNLDQYIGLAVERGAGKASGSLACTGFASRGQVWSGSLADFPSTSQAGVKDGTLDAGATRVYRYTATLSADNAAQARTSNVAFTFSGTGEPPAPVATPTAAPTPVATPVPEVELIPIETKPGETCITYHLQGGQVMKKVKVTKRIGAQLKIRQIAPGTAKERLTLQVSLKNWRGRTLFSKAWAKVTFRRNGKVIGRPKRRPFKVAMKPSALRTGDNRLNILIRNRHGKSSRAKFVLTVGKALRGTETVCFINNTITTGTKRPAKG